MNSEGSLAGAGGGLLVFFAIVVVTIVALIYMRARGREEWMTKAQLVFEQTGTSH